MVGFFAWASSTWLHGRHQWAAGPCQDFAAADLELVERYVAGEIPPAEAAAFAQQLSSDPERAALVQALTAIWNGEDPGTPSFDVHALWARALPRVRERRHNLSLHRHDATRASLHAWRASPRLLKTAALTAFAIGAMGWFTVLRDRRDKAGGPVMREFSTSRGERADLRLDDGSQIVLGAATTLRVPTTSAIAP